MLRQCTATILLGAALVLAPTPAAVACTCLTKPVGKPSDLAGRHNATNDHAFIGSVTSIGDEPVTAGRRDGGPDYEPGRYVPVVLDVEVELAGKVPGTAIVLQQAPQARRIDTCAFRFEEGRRYLVEARKTADGTFLTDICTFTQLYGGGAPLVEENTAAPTGSPVAPVVVLVLLAVAAAAILRLTFKQREA